MKKIFRLIGWWLYGKQLEKKIREMAEEKINNPHSEKRSLLYNNGCEDHVVANYVYWWFRDKR